MTDKQVKDIVGTLTLIFYALCAIAGGLLVGIIVE